jgi:transcriptional regulator with XRE-family HTH domain
MTNAVKPIPKRELLAYQADVKGAIFRQIRQIFARLKESGFTQKEWATKISMNEGQLSRRLRGDYDPQLETLSDLARGLECRIDVRLTPLSEVAKVQREVRPVSDNPIDPAVRKINPTASGRPISASPPVNDNSPRIEIVAS